MSLRVLFASAMPVNQFDQKQTSIYQGNHVGLRWSFHQGEPIIHLHLKYMMKGLSLSPYFESRFSCHGQLCPYDNQEP